jgi:hypothetical protein
VYDAYDKPSNGHAAILICVNGSILHVVRKSYQNRRVYSKPRSFLYRDVCLVLRAPYPYSEFQSFFLSSLSPFSPSQASQKVETSDGKRPGAPAAMNKLALVVAEKVKMRRSR